MWRSQRSEALPARPSSRPLVGVLQLPLNLTEIFGVGPVIAATVIGEAGDVSRFAGRDAFAAYNGAAPIKVSGIAAASSFRVMSAPGDELG